MIRLSHKHFVAEGLLYKAEICFKEEENVYFVKWELEDGDIIHSDNLTGRIAAANYIKEIWAENMGRIVSESEQE